eukprot:m.196496 g.196496  ORF g.196496 m.196496 type:complete len:383 (+) comp18327_c0_seq5:488-1636(+)
MHVGIRCGIAVAMLGMLVVIAGAQQALPAHRDQHTASQQQVQEPTHKIKGVNFVANSFEGAFTFSDPRSDASLAVLANLGANHVQLSFSWYQQDTNSTGPIRQIVGPTPSGKMLGNASSPTDKDLAHAVAKAKSLGLNVTLRPLVDSLDSIVGNGWARSAIGARFSSAEWSEWFQTYQAFQFHYAELAQKWGVDGFNTGAEMSATYQQTTLWRETIAGIRSRFHGQVSLSTEASSVTRPQFWDALDYIGVDGYFGVPHATNQTSLEDLKAMWATHIATLQSLSEQFQKPVVFSEIGCCAVPGEFAFAHPAAIECARVISTATDGGGGNDSSSRIRDALMFHDECISDHGGLVGCFVWFLQPLHERQRTIQWHCTSCLLPLFL